MSLPSAPPVVHPVRPLSRRRLVVWSALPATAVLCLAAKLLSVGLLADAAARSFEAGEAGAVAEAAAGLRVANVIEPAKAAFAEGDSRVLAGDYAGARQRFEEALSQAGPADGCIIRVNLVLSIERLGDERMKAEEPTAAGRLFAEGLAVVGSAPDGCFAAAGSGDPGPPAGERLDQAAGRLKDKADAGAAGAAAGTRPPQAEVPGTGTTDADPGRQSQLDQLKDSSREAQRERNNGQEREEYLRNGGNGAGPERPW